jgi:short-subunit dehydrogenase
MAPEYVLITGASSGIGLHLAKEFAQHGHSLILVAPSEDEIERIALEIRNQHRVEAIPLAADLEEPDSAQKIFDEAERNGWVVDTLVNNAGFGQKGRFWEIPIQRDISMVRVNIEAVLKLTKLFLKPMRARGRGRILNLSSIAGFQPGPLLAVYHATKAFILSWSEALATELEDTEITVTALCPGATDTDFFPKADMMSTRALQKGKVMAPQEVAETGYQAVMDGERVVVAGALNKSLVFSRRFLPESAQAKFNQKLYEGVPPEEREHSRGDWENAEGD